MESLCRGCLKPLSKRQYVFCSSSCQRGLEWTQRKIKIIQTGIEDSSRVAKRFLLETRGHSCEICKMQDEWQGKKLILVLDHIDGNSENNFIENQRLICPNCDSQLPTFKNKNRGNGRFLRKVRYRAGKSF